MGVVVGVCLVGASGTKLLRLAAQARDDRDEVRGGLAGALC
jgi:hypothetical protein